MFGFLKVHVLTAQGLRADESGHAPSAWILLRILNPTLADPTSHSSSVATHVCKSDGSYTSPASYVWSWGQEFQLDVPDGGQSQLQITLWDNAKPSGTAEAFLGEVILNLAKVIPHEGQHVEQNFDLKQGRRFAGKMPTAKGTLRLHMVFKLGYSGEQRGLSLLLCSVCVLWYVCVSWC
jgi:hypothetical protein